MSGWDFILLFVLHFLSCYRALTKAPLYLTLTDTLTNFQAQVPLQHMQETEINPNLDHNLLSFPGYGVEVESNDLYSMSN